MSTLPDTERGLYGKYRVERIDGKDKGPYFVLAPNTDPYAVNAIEEYAAACSETHPQLSEDLLLWRDSAQDLHPEHFPPPQPLPELTEADLRYDYARAMGPTLLDQIGRVTTLANELACGGELDRLYAQRIFVALAERKEDHL